MRVDVMQHYGFTQPLSQAGYYETRHRQQLMTDMKSAILEGHLIALCGVIGSGKTVTLRRLQQQLKDDNRVLVSKSLAVDKHRITLGTLITALFYDLSTEKPVRIPTQSEKRERDLRELVKKGKRPVVLFVDEAHDLTRHTLTDLKRLLEVVEDGDGKLSPPAIFRAPAVAFLPAHAAGCARGCAKRCCPAWCSLQRRATTAHPRK